MNFTMSYDCGIWGMGDQKPNFNYNIFDFYPNGILHCMHILGYNDFYLF